MACRSKEVDVLRVIRRTNNNLPVGEELSGINKNLGAIGVSRSRNPPDVRQVAGDVAGTSYRNKFDVVFDEQPLDRLVIERTVERNRSTDDFGAPAMRKVIRMVFNVRNKGLALLAGDKMRCNVDRTSCVRSKEDFLLFGIRSNESHDDPPNFVEQIARALRQIVAPAMNVRVVTVEEFVVVIEYRTRRLSARPMVEIYDVPRLPVGSNESSRRNREIGPNFR